VPETPSRDLLQATPGNDRSRFGLPGGKRIFPSALQALLNLTDHGMTLQEAVEAPREVEAAVPEAVRHELRSMGHDVQAVPTVAGGMNAIQFYEDGRLTGAACWRADGTPIGLAGAPRAGIRFGLA
jgi:gamma-glutamyltranspeptidase/glutathione hydrolase